jgi:hypothetical protein
MIKPELSNEQIEMKVGRMAMRVEHEMEGAIRSARYERPQSSITGAPSGIHGHDARHCIRHPKGGVDVRPA